MEFWLIIIGIIVLIWTIGKLSEYLQQKRIATNEEVKKLREEIVEAKKS